MGDDEFRDSPSASGINTLLAALRRPRPDSAWTSFLERFAGRIMRVVRLRQYDPQRAEDCFLFVCECLSDDGFRRLQQFDPERGVSFPGWLDAVVANLCVEWHRREFGRLRIPPAIERLSELDRVVFRHRYQQDLDLQTCLYLLQQGKPQITRQDLADSLARIQSALSGRQRWSLARQHERSSASRGYDAPANDPPDPDPGPERTLAERQHQSRMRWAMNQLEAEDRLLLRLRFEQDLPFTEVARIAGLGNLHLARRRIEAALKRLEELLSEEPSP
jgi:DNA-directed RNA polymerase specialized sigma24 family protein